ncbi:CBS domain-containing protein [Sporolactobacillus putidus]|uniref:CBS domain-containing protein n=1 Tax=Sporolactobacillus putidus TaxID=492735 RepID=A0A917S3X2_9BACL|nr:CBS domain-containing protein [Sporolactobacillus putidus]GGL53672.1 CBS domain-containing protein [Sporolactobacillus putidus]
MVQTLRQVMTSDIVSCSPNQTLKEAAELMSRHNIGSIPVINNGKLEGIITDRDITLRSAARGKDDDKVTVKECMTSSNLISGTPDMDVHEAARLMSEKQIRRLPIVENNRVVGIVSLGDLATENRFQDEAGKALSGISTPSGR